MRRGLNCPRGGTGGRFALRSIAAATATSLFALAASAAAQSTTDFTFTKYVTYTTVPNGPARIWLPAAITPLRGVMVFDNFAPDGAGDPFTKDPTAITAYRNAAAAMGFGLLTTPKSLDGLSAAKTQQTIDGLLASAASATGRGQVANLPIVPIGFSGAGDDAMSVGQRYPSRVITYVANRITGSVVTEIQNNQTVSGAQPGWTGMSGLFLGGAVDDNQRPSWISASVMKGGPNNGYTHTPAGSAIREMGGLAALGVLPERGHGDDHAANPVSEGYEFAMYWIARNANARLAGTAAAAATPGNPVALTPLAKTSGWLGEADRYQTVTALDAAGKRQADIRAGTSPFKPIASHADYAGDKDAASWMVDQDLAFAYRAALSNDGGHHSRNSFRSGTPLLFSAVSPLQSFALGDTANLSIDPRDFDDSLAIKQMAFYDGAALLGTDANAADGWGISTLFSSAGVRGLSVVATRSDGQVRAGFRAVSVVPEPAGLAIVGLGVAACLRRRRGD